MTHPFRDSPAASSSITSSGDEAQHGVFNCADIVRHQYAQDNILQSYEVYIPPEAAESDIGNKKNKANQGDKYWVIYIHGGAYRDPLITSSSFFHRTVPILLNDPIHARTSSQISGYASLNYRLSPHPSHPQDALQSPTYELRAAKHPEHIDDVLTAIAALQKRYGFGEKYILVGHSVGATMSFQVAMSQHRPWSPSSSEEPDPPPRASSMSHDPTPNSSLPTTTSSPLPPPPPVLPPHAILGVCGIYSFPALLASFPETPIYRQFITSALGSSPSLWSAISPSTWSRTQYANSWPNARLALLAHSHSDELVDWRQVEEMAKVFSTASPPRHDDEHAPQSHTRLPCTFRILELKGTHNSPWQTGSELARAITETMRTLRALDLDLDS